MGKQVKTPRFYVDIPSFLHAVGQYDNVDTDTHGVDLLYMNAANQKLTQYDNNYISQNTYLNTHKIGKEHMGTTGYPINFVALLNHNLGYFCGDNSNGTSGFEQGNLEARFTFKRLEYHQSPTPDDAAHEVTPQGRVNILNSGVDTLDGILIKPMWSGTSIWSFDEIDGIWSSFALYFKDDQITGNLEDLMGEGSDGGVGLGSMVVGRYWDAPHNPDLSLTMSRRFEGIKSKKTIGGKTLSNIYYDGPTEWNMVGIKGWNGHARNNFKYPVFELDDALPSSTHADSFSREYGSNYYRGRAKSGLGRKGLRSWKLTFSYISEDDMWMAYESSSGAPFSQNLIHSNVTETDVPTDNGRLVSEMNPPEEGKTNPMLSDNSFNFVWNCTLGGTLPFIFQPDNTNNNPDQFSICTFRENTLNVKQVAHNVYSLSVTIDEVA